ncbi:GNAT family N-acetyltransferase [Puniceibacterium sediminis]|uniref:Ribosomal-protein-alanine N-acetyltransferase n=1 Tax=Puniceibacterium sediminis TaxID=1608407 RepID=A0A238WNJ3_9RHOB|nr:GNAT family N-acetyltransferase [Puniceibacterium sediminis]SNR47961.1 ribosomal-protein-alanine N-acetyltransferase [Puniceibacterium sediminis]
MNDSLGARGNPAALAALQSRAYRDMSPWSARDFADLLDHPTALLTAQPHAFCLGRIIVDEAEILALATDPAHQRQGLASGILLSFLQAAAGRGAVTVFLEVAATNVAALAFYRKHGFDQSGLRKGYYPQPDGSRTDALLMSRALTQGHGPNS